MKFDETKCRLITTGRSTTYIHQFHKSWKSNPNLVGIAEVKYVDSSFARHKQKFLSSHMMIWMKAWVLIVHDLAGKSNCHWWTHASTVLESWRNPLDLASNNSNYASRWWLDQEPNKVYAKNLEKSEREKMKSFLI